MLNLKQTILRSKNIEFLEDELQNIENIQISEQFINDVQQSQIQNIIDKSYLLFQTQEQQTPNVQNLDSNAIVYLINRNMKISIMKLITKIVMKKIDQLSINEQMLTFLDTVIDFIYDMVVQDEIAIQCYGFACFKTFEKLEMNENSEEVEIFNSNYTFKILQKIRKITKYLLYIFLSNENQIENFLEKYEILMVKCLKSTNYFSQYSGLIFLSNILKATETSYHSAIYKLLQEMELSQNIMMHIYRLFCLFSTEEQILRSIFSKVSASSLNDQIQFLNNFIHDGAFMDICYTYRFTQSRYECFVQEYSPVLQNFLLSYYNNNLKQIIEDLPNYIKQTNEDNQDVQIQKQKVISAILRNAKLFNINTSQLYSDLKQSLEILLKILPNNSINSYIVNNLISIILFYNITLFSFHEIVNLIPYITQQSTLNSFTKAKIYVLLMYANVPDNSQLVINIFFNFILFELQTYLNLIHILISSKNISNKAQILEMKQVGLKKRFSKLIKDTNNVKLEYFIFNTLEIYLNSPEIEELHANFDQNILDMFIEFIQRSEKFQIDNNLFFDNTLSNTKTTKSYCQLVENLQKSASIFEYINKIKMLVPTIPANDKENIITKINEIVEQINF